MRTKTISKVISKKIQDWINSIEDIGLRNSILENVVVTGGCITSMLLKQSPNDYDIYFTDAKLCKRVAEYYVKKMTTDNIPVHLTDAKGSFENTPEFNPKLELHVHTYIGSSGYLSEKRDVLDADEEADELLQDEIEMTPAEKVNTDKGEKSRYRPVFITSNAITLSNKIQLITRFCGDPKKIHENFDFSHTKMYWTKADGVVTNVDALECVLAKRLIYSGSKFPLCSFIRTRKFIQRGWTIDAGQYVKMGIQLSGMDLLDPKVLVQQLVGVDTTYFSWLLDELTKPEKLVDGKVDMQYAISLINFMFDCEKGG